MTVHYKIFPVDPSAHLFEVVMEVRTPGPTGQRFMLPTWIPGSYMIREFARNIVQISAAANGQPLAMEKLDKCTWRCAPSIGPLTLRYTVYAWDLSVRAAHLDLNHGFFNGSSVFLLAEGLRDRACTLEIIAPMHTAAWKVATSLPRAPLAVSGKKPPNSPPNIEFGHFIADDYDQLIDHPVEMGEFSISQFEACGVPHYIVLTGRHRADIERLGRDLKRICEAQIALFDPIRKSAPFEAYWFLITAVGDGFGGLEHRNSTALICSRDELPFAQQNGVTAAYRRLLSLASHEYFHAWNVKRIMPSSFQPYDLSEENYTRQLWFFEGITDYYDDLMLRRAGLITELEYLEVEAENIGRVCAQNGRSKQSLAEASFDAWVKYYRQDENAPNALVSYYQKGAIVGLVLDLAIREKSGGARSLDDVMRVLWCEFAVQGLGVPEDGIQRVVERVTGHSFAEFFARYVDGTVDFDWSAIFNFVGIEVTWRVPSTSKSEGDPAWLGAQIAAEPTGEAKLAQVFDHGPARRAGLSAGDVVIAVDGLRVSASTLNKRIRSYPVDASVTLTYFRRDELNQALVRLDAHPKHTCVLSLRELPIEASARRTRWLNGD